MNNYLKILLAASLLTIPCLSWAQEKEEKKEEVRLPLPAAPILEEVAKNQQWRIKLKGLAPGVEAPANPELLGVEIIERLFKKMDTVRYLEKKWSDNKKTGAWIFAPYQLEEATYSPGLIEIRDANSGTDGDFTKSDFPDLGWINESNYITTDKVGGKLCYLFKKPAASFLSDVRMSPEFTLAVVDPKKLTEDKVWVSVETQLPVQIEVSGKIFEYSFSALSGGIPEAPAKVLELKTAMGLK
ncbi:MAG: hypothetical protein SH807_00160 [Blastochloris sp.]|nr:hypothetical protein [Blastochloris sp.]